MLMTNTDKQTPSLPAANRLTTVKDGASAVIATYTYDGDGQRLAKTASGVSITYHYFGGQLMYETSSQYPEKITARYTRHQKENYSRLISIALLGIVTIITTTMLMGMLLL
jgi:YD repeat-containing protein